MRTSASADISPVVSANVAIPRTSRSMMRTYSRRLKRASKAADIGLERTGTHSCESFLKFFAGVGAIEAALARETIKEVGILHQGLAQPRAMTEHHHCVMHQRKVLIEQAHELSRSSFRKPLELVYRRVRIRSIG